MRTFVLRARAAPTDPQRLLAAIGQEAHPEILAHTLMNAFFVAQSHRADVVVYLVLAWLLFPVAIGLILGLFAEDVVAAVERRYYPELPAPPGMSLSAQVYSGARFLAVALPLNLIALPLYLVPGANIPVYLALNGYLLGREYFTLVAGQRLPLREMEQLRRGQRGRLWLAGAVTTVGAQLSVVAVPTQIYQLTGSSAWVGLTGVFGLVPLIVFGLWGGAIADAVDRRTLLLVSGTGIAASALLLWVTSASGVGGVWLVLSLFGATFLAALANRGTTLAGAAALAACLVVFSIALFKWALGLPIALTGSWLPYLG